MVSTEEDGAVVALPEAPVLPKGADCKGDFKSTASGASWPLAASKERTPPMVPLRMPGGSDGFLLLPC